MEYVISGQRAREIRDFESEMYKKIAGPYFPYFSQYGCSLNLKLLWENPVHKMWDPCRLPLVNGYRCYVYCVVQRNGKDVHIISYDGEADYYPLLTGWLTSINRHFLKLKISLYDDMNDINEDLRGLLLQLKGLEAPR